jgi:transcriptional regulator
MLGAIVGLRLPLHGLIGKWKVSQNRDAADRAGVAGGLAPATEGSAPGWTMAELVRDTAGPAGSKP